MKILPALAVLVSFSVRAEPPSPEDVAAIQREQGSANAEIEKKYGNKPSSELSQDERRQMIKDKAEAEAKVLDKHGVTAKDFARGQAKQSLSDRAATKAASDKMEKQDAEDKKKAAAAAKDGAKGPAAGGNADTADNDAAEAAAADRAAGYGAGSGGKKKGR